MPFSARINLPAGCTCVLHMGDCWQVYCGLGVLVSSPPHFMMLLLLRTVSHELDCNSWSCRLFDGFTVSQISSRNSAFRLLSLYYDDRKSLMGPHEARSLDAMPSTAREAMEPSSAGALLSVLRLLHVHAAGDGHPDRLPARVLPPAGHALLPPGESPAYAWQAQSQQLPLL